MCLAIISNMLIVGLGINMKARIEKLEVKVEYLISKLETKSEHLKD